MTTTTKKGKGKIVSLREAYQAWREQCPIRTHRLAKGMTQAMLGALVGLSGWTLSKYESAGSSPNPAHMEALSQILEAPELRQELKEWRRAVPR
jgi:hypothetical protein